MVKLTLHYDRNGQKNILVGQAKNYYISYSLKKSLEVINIRKNDI